MSGAFTAEIMRQVPMANIGNVSLGGGGSAAKGSGLNIGALANLGIAFLGNAIDGQQKAQAAAAYQTYLNDVINKMQNSLEARANKYDNKLQEQFNLAEPEFQNEANTALPELAKLQQDLINENTDAQRANRRQIEATMARQGIRGGQAAILENRALGEQSRDTQRDINQLAYNEAANRQNARLNYYNQKALTPWNTLSNAYGSSMVGANNSLSSAQGNVYQNAYNHALNNQIASQRNNSGFRLF